MKAKEAKRFFYAVVRAMDHLERHHLEPETVVVLKELLNALFQEAEMQGRAKHMSCRDTYPETGNSVKDVLLAREKDGEKHLLEELGVSRSTFYRRLAQLKEYATSRNLDVQELDFWTSETW